MSNSETRINESTTNDEEFYPQISQITQRRLASLGRNWASPSLRFATSRPVRQREKNRTAVRSSLTPPRPGAEIWTWERGRNSVARSAARFDQAISSSLPRPHAQILSAPVRRQGTSFLIRFFSRCQTAHSAARNPLPVAPKRKTHNPSAAQRPIYPAEKTRRLKRVLQIASLLSKPNLCPSVPHLWQY